MWTYHWSPQLSPHAALCITCEKHNEAYSEDPSAAGPPDVPPGDVDPLGIADIQPLRIREALTQYFAQE